MATELRAARPQPWWPRLLGVACLGLAICAALRPLAPMPSHGASRASAAPGLRLERPRAVRSAAAAAESALPARFAWQPGAAAPPFTLVVLDADYRELLRREGLGTTEWTPDVGVVEACQPGGTYHWYVVAEVAGQRLASPLESFEQR